MGYQALYRTYRPKRFSDVVGQNVIIRTLQNAILNNKVAHAYLFSGPRGTGKTSVAKIFAKAVNCEKAPSLEPCGECETCQLIEEGHLSDVIEIDAASNNGVEEIRELRDKVNYLPSFGKYKVYIIDEVHMLTQAAFNALLKTLEEPPAHVIFILATTEPNKVIPTILSRCQRFDFRGISPSDINKKLIEIRDKEEIDISDEALNEIALNAEGGLRDAISLLDQTVSFSGEKITIEDVYQVSGSVSKDNLIKLVNYLKDKDASNAFFLLNEIIEDGKEISKIVADIIALLRDILIEKNITFEIERPTSYLKDLAQDYSNDRLFFYLDVLNETQNNIKWTMQKRAYLELALFKMIDHQDVVRIEEKEEIGLLMNKINELERSYRELEKRPVQEIVVKNSEEEIKSQPKRKDGREITVKEIEEILNSGNKTKKNLLARGWPNLANLKTPHLQTTAELLLKGELVACSDDKMLIVYPDKTSCLMLLRESTKKLALEIINSKENHVNDIVCLDKTNWDLLFTSFLKQWGEGNKKPKLPKVDLGIFATNEKKYQSETLSLAKDFFGADKVIVEGE
ncbi:MAG: DNA polymerase III subunit gamma/tau [Acholeplasmataceae bacterium]|nr:DNA polymerase III subunit gamma/tau [Acholeplasmataceae bacterium]MCK9234587.1 DNA polymerase III subunit gamma/tau [Acholeplasmataceae bacterium]MCK9427433.1 DNA polymerase III subunit gamma/tau [Acholeplasmataceae bacterium]HHT38964.1 DNA polymerase III subunit gamma/tau [Acholeplasmataceae bacterium]